MKGYVALILAGASVGLIGPMIKLIDGTIPIMTVSFFRMLIATLLLLVVLPFIDREIFKISRKEMWHYAMLGFLIAVNFSTYMMAFSLAPISNVVLLTYTFPLWLAIFSHYFLKEKVTRFILFCFALAFIGVAIMNPFQTEYFLGSIIALVTAFIYAVIYAFMRHIDKRHSIGVVFWFMMFATIFLSPAPFIFGIGTVGMNYLWVFVLGIMSTAAAYTFLNYGMERIQAEKTSIVTMTTESIIAIALSILFIGEVLTLNVLFGGILILAAAIFIEHKYGLTKK